MDFRKIEIASLSLAMTVLLNSIIFAETLASKILNTGGGLRQSSGITFTDSIGEDFTTVCSSNNTQFYAGYIYSIFFDTVPPVSILEISEPYFNLEDKIVITNKTVFTLFARDPLVWGISSGVKISRWQIADGGWQDYSLPFTLHDLSDGDYAVKYYSVDNVNNTEKVKTAIVVLDNTAPVVKILSPSKDSYGVSKIINGQVSIYGSATDKHLKYYEVTYNQINSSVSVSIAKEYKEVREGILAIWDTTQLTEGWYTLKLTAQDCVKNEASTTVDIYVGKPELLLTVNGFNKPSYIVIDSTCHIYISDTNNDSVKKFDKDGNFILEISTMPKVADTSARAKRSENIFNKPTGIAVNSQGNIFVADRNNDRVVVFNSASAFVSEIKGFNKPHGIFIDKKNNLYVADRNNDRIQKYDSSGNLIMTIDTGIEDDGLNKPQGVMTVDSIGRIYITDRNNDRILVYSSTGNYITQITSATTGLNKPDGIYVTDDGYIFVSDTNNDNVVMFAAERYNFIPLMSFSGFNKPAGITFDSEGNLYVVDSNNDRVQKFGLPPKTKLFASSPISQSLNLSISDFVLGEVYAYPNPAKRGVNSKIHIEVGIADILEIRIYNIAGEKVYSVEIDGNNYRTENNKYYYEYEWNISDVASGVYIYLVKARKNEETIKVLKKLAVVK